MGNTQDHPASTERGKENDRKSTNRKSPKKKKSSTKRKKKRKHPRRKPKDEPRTVLNMLQQNIVPPDIALMQSFNLFDISGTGTIQIEDLAKVLQCHGVDNLKYEDLREMVHQAVNSYEITFDQYRQIMTSDEMEIKQKQLEQRRDSSTQPYGKHKDQYGIYLPNHARSVSDLKSITRDHRLKNSLVGKPKALSLRSASVDVRYSALEQDVLELKTAFSIFDLDKVGAVKAKHVVAVMKGMRISTTPAEVKQLFRLVCNDDQDLRGGINFDQFRELYSLCL